MVEKYQYDAYGKPSITDGSGNPLTATAYGNRFLFTGREYLAELNLYDYRNRVYSPDLGRFLQTDPERFSAGDVNIYRYCGNDPSNAVDPDGTTYAGFWAGVGVGAAVTPGGTEIGAVVGGAIGTLIEPGGGTAVGAAIGGWLGGLAAGTYGAWVAQEDIDNYYEQQEECPGGGG